MKRLSVFTCFALLLLSQLTMAQASREYVRNQIRQWGECKNVAITKYNGDLALYGRNGWAGTGLPKSLSEALNELNEDGKQISDVQITDDGNWLILIGDNGFRWSNIPSDLEYQLRRFNERNDKVTSVTFNDAGDWIIISEEYVSASEDWIQDWLKAGMDRFGALWAACITSDAMVACYESGYKFYGNIPSDLRSALQETDINVYRIKIAGDAWFFSDGKRRFRYNM